MANEITLNSNRNTIPASHSVSCLLLDAQKSERVPQNENACVQHSQGDQAPPEDTSNDMDMYPGSSRNCCQSLDLVVEVDSYANLAPWFVRHPDSLSVHSSDSVVCRICHNSENPEKLVSPCLCKGSLTYVHLYCLEQWISTSRCTTCELCQFQYNTQQTLRYSLFQSLRIWYSRSMSRRALQEDCQMFSLLTLVAFGIIGTLMVAVQYYIMQGHLTGIGRLWTKGWLIFFLFTTLVVYIINVYMIAKTQLTPWYRWWQSARDIRLILENHKPFHCDRTTRQSQRRRQLQNQPQSLLNQYQLLSVAPQTSIETPTVLGSKTLNAQANNATICHNTMQSLPQDSSGITANQTTKAPTTIPAADANNDAKTKTAVIDLPTRDEANYISVPAGASAVKSDTADDDDVDNGHNDDDNVSTSST